MSRIEDQLGKPDHDPMIYPCMQVEMSRPLGTIGHSRITAKPTTNLYLREYELAAIL
jgi:hypothetical protein